jgi:polyribonucleotide 5'-hydroxyl-kinase
MLSIPGTIAASPMTAENMSPQASASSSSLLPNASPLVFWYGSTDLSSSETSNPDLYKSFLDKMGQCIDARLSDGNSSNNNANPQENHFTDAKASGIIVNGCGWIEDMGFELVKHSIQALDINVVLVMGHDRLYSMLSTLYNKMREQKQKGDISIGNNTATPKVIKLPRSGGIVTRNPDFRHVSRILSMKQYFYGESIVPNSTYANTLTNLATSSITSNSEGLSVSTSSLVNQYAPSLIELNFSDVRIYKMENVNLSSSMLPVSAKQTSEAVQLTQIHDIEISLKHRMLAVCHPMAVEKYERSGEPRDLYMAGVTGFVVVEKIDENKEIISLLSPCAGSLASSTLLAANITWRE